MTIPQRGGLPHSDIHGSTPARGSPWLFAACHVLHRLSVPRHPPDALVSRLITASPWPAMPTTAAHRAKPHALPPATTGADGLYEDTSLGPARSKPCSPGRSASVTSQLSLHPSINPTAKARGGVARSSPNVGPGLPAGAQPAAGSAPLAYPEHLVPATPWWR